MDIRLKILLSLYFGFTVDCRPQESKAQTKYYYFDIDNDFLKNFAFNVDTTNGIHQDAHGYFESTSDGESLAIKGRYSYTGPDGVVYSVSYIADRNGFQPYGKHIPQFGPEPTSPIAGAPIGDACYASACGTGMG